MKIVLCSHDGYNYYGGPYEWVKRIGCEFKRRGHEVVYLILSDHSKAKSSLYKTIRDQGFESYHRPANTYSQIGDNTEDRVRWFVKKCRSIKPDIFVANNVLEALYACQFFKIKRIKCFGILHSDDKRLKWMKDLFISRRDFGPSNIVFVSKHLYNKHINEAGPNFIIGCGTKIINEHARYSSSPLRIVYAGKLTVESKQIYKHLDTFKSLSKTFGERIRIDIYGRGNEVEGVKSRIRNNHFIEYKGFVDSDKLLSVLLDYQVFILLSDYEGLPIAIMEAMGIGLVPICLNIESGIPELIENGENGFIVKNRDKDVLSVVKELLEDPHKWKQLSEKAREKIHGSYTTQSVCDMWESAFVKANTQKYLNYKRDLPEIHKDLVRVDIRKPSFLTYLIQQYLRIRRHLKKTY